MSLELLLGIWPRSIRRQRDLADDAEADLAVSQRWLESVAAGGTCEERYIEKTAAADDSAKTQVIPREFLLDATDWTRSPEQFHPGKATPYLGYGYQLWIFPGSHRKFALIGVYGQSIFVDPQLKLVIVQAAANATAEAGQTSLGSDRQAFWNGVVRYYGKW